MARRVNATAPSTASLVIGCSSTARFPSDSDSSFRPSPALMTQRIPRRRPLSGSSRNFCPISSRATLKATIDRAGSAWAREIWPSKKLRGSNEPVPSIIERGYTDALIRIWRNDSARPGRVEAPPSARDRVFSRNRANNGTSQLERRSQFRPALRRSSSRHRQCSRSNGRR